MSTTLWLFALLIAALVGVVTWAWLRAAQSHERFDIDDDDE